MERHNGTSDVLKQQSTMVKLFHTLLTIWCLQIIYVCGHDGPSVDRETEFRDALLGAFNFPDKLDEYFCGAIDRFIYQCKLDADEIVNVKVDNYDKKKSIQDAIRFAYESTMKGYPQTLVGSLHECNVDKQEITMSTFKQSTEYCQSLKTVADTSITQCGCSKR